MRVIEFVILDIVCLGFMLQENSQKCSLLSPENAPTVVYWPPERIPVIAFDIEGFSATHNTLMKLVPRGKGLSNGPEERKIRLLIIADLTASRRVK